MKIEDELEKRKKTSVWKEIKNLPPYTTFAAFSFLLIGSLLLYFSKTIAQDDSDRFKALLTIGFILFLPGLYASFIIINVVLQTEGYSIDDIPSYDE